MVSAGTLLAALGLGRRRVLGGALFYLVSSTLALAAPFFLLVDLVERWRAGATVVDEAPFLSATLEAQEVNLDDEEEPLVGRPSPRPRRCWAWPSSRACCSSPACRRFRPSSASSACCRRALAAAQAARSVRACMAVHRACSGLRPAHPHRAHAHGHPDLLVGSTQRQPPRSARPRRLPCVAAARPVCGALTLRGRARDGARPCGGPVALRPPRRTLHAVLGARCGRQPPRRRLGR